MLPMLLVYQDRINCAGSRQVQGAKKRRRSLWNYKGGTIIEQVTAEGAHGFQLQPRRRSVSNRVSRLARTKPCRRHSDARVARGRSRGGLGSSPPLASQAQRRRLDGDQLAEGIRWPWRYP